MNLLKGHFKEALHQVWFVIQVIKGRSNFFFASYYRKMDHIDFYILRIRVTRSMDCRPMLPLRHFLYSYVASIDRQ